MKNIKEFLFESNISKFKNWMEYLDILKKTPTSFDEFKRVMDKEFYIDDVAFDNKDHKIYAYFNPNNNAEGNDIEISINIKGNERRFTVVDYESEEV